eukprot:Em0003g1808a
MALDFSKRPKRTTKRTPKAKELEGSCEEIQSRSIKVKCGQTGKVFVTKIHNLSKEDQAESLTIEDLKVGAGLLCDVKGKMYPVEVLEFEDGCADASEKDVVHSLMGPSTISKVKIHDSGDQSKRAVLLHAIEGSASTLEATSSLIFQAIMKKQFPTEPFDLQVFTQKANQKCRDAATMHRPLPKDIVEL